LNQSDKAGKMMNRMLMLLLVLLIVQFSALAQTPPRPTPESTPESTTAAAALGAPVTDLEDGFQVRLPLDWLAQPYARRIYFGTSREAVAIDETVPDSLPPGEIGGFVTVATAGEWLTFISAQTASDPAEATPEAVAEATATPDSALVRPVELLLAVQASYGNRPTGVRCAAGVHAGCRNRATGCVHGGHGAGR
jgi:hypothetical protein